MKVKYLFSDRDCLCLEPLSTTARSVVESASHDDLIKNDAQWFTSVVVSEAHAYPISLGAPTQVVARQLKCYPTEAIGQLFVPEDLYLIRHRANGYLPLFNRRPSVSSDRLPSGYISGNTLVFEYIITSSNPTKTLKSIHDENLDLVKKYMAWANNDLRLVISSLPTLITRLIEERRRVLNFH